MTALKFEHVPSATVKRLSMYSQTLENLVDDEDMIVSSDVLARECGVNPAQVRKDLSFFGEFGIRGLGYNARDLLGAIKRCLGVDHPWYVGLAGIGGLGRTLIRNPLIPARGLHIVAVFDADRSRIGEEISGLEVYCIHRIPEIVPALGIDFGLIATPPAQAQRAADHFVDAGVKGLINFSPVRLSVPKDVVVEYVDFFEHIHAVTFALERRQLHRPRAYRQPPAYRQPSFLAWP